MASSSFSRDKSSPRPATNNSPDQLSRIISLILSPWDVSNGLGSLLCIAVSKHDYETLLILVMWDGNRNRNLHSSREQRETH